MAEMQRLRECPGATTSPPQHRRQLFALLAALIAAGGGCGDLGGDSMSDCINQFGGTKPCGPAWDSDRDTISTATETDPTNRTTNLPIAGFYTFDTLAWDLNLSLARGQPNDFSGWLDRGMNLRDQGAGYLHDRVCENAEVDDWGTAHLLRLVEGSGRDWASYLSPLVLPRVQVLDLSLRTGGFFGSGCPPDHDSHRNGLDVDVRYVRMSGAEGPLNICNEGLAYDTLATRDLFATIVVFNGDGADGRPWVEFVLADMDCLGFLNDPDDPYIVHDPDHRNHFHVRIRDPDGTFN